MQTSAMTKVALLMTALLPLTNCVVMCNYDYEIVPQQFCLLQVV